MIEHVPLKRLISTLTLLFVFSFSLSAQQGDPVNGKKLFNTHCAACHKLDKKLIGPPLKGVSEKRTNKWLQSWIKDNNALRESGDQDAIDIFKEYNGMPMTPYPQLTEQDINDVIAYTDDKPVESKTAAATTQAVDPKVKIGKKSEEASEFSSFARKNFDLARSWRGMGYALVEMGKLEDAENQYYKCLDLDENDKKAIAELKYISGLRTKKN